MVSITCFVLHLWPQIKMLLMTVSSSMAHPTQRLTEQVIERNKVHCHNAKQSDKNGFRYMLLVKGVKHPANSVSLQYLKSIGGHKSVNR